MRLYGVRKLSEMDGTFYVHIRCRACGRRSAFLAKVLAAKLGANADLDLVKEKLKCMDCDSRSAWVWSDSDALNDEDQFDDLL
jgi:hypothetical protein